MKRAEQLIDEFKTLPVTTVGGALYLALYDSDNWTEYTDGKRCFMFAYISYSDGSSLRIHRSGKVEYRKTGKVIAKINLYTHAEQANEEKLNDAGI